MNIFCFIRTKRCVLCVFAVMFVLVTGTICAQERILPSGISETELPSRLDAYFKEHAETTAAAAVAVFRGDTVLYRKSTGFADKKNNIAADDATVFEWGSATKMLVWTAVMQLTEQGKINLDAPIQTYLPENFLTKLSYNDVISVRNLMHHNAGWEDVIVGLFTQNKRDIDELEAVLQRSEPKQIYRPGTVCAYSNWGVALAGYIVERLSGMSFYEYVQQNIFAPLGMKNTALSPDLSDNPAVRSARDAIRGYDPSGQIVMPDRFYIPLYPAGMTTGTLYDFMLFAQALVPAEGENSPLFASRKTLDEMLTPSMFYGNTGLARNSHGLWVSHFAVPAYGHGGNTAAMSAYLLIDPETRYGVTVMTNQGGEQIFNVKMMPLIFGDVRDSVFARNAAGTDIVALTANSKGYYTSARTVTSGPCKIYSMLMTMPLPALKSVKMKMPEMGGSLELIAPNVADFQSPIMNTLAVIQPDSYGYDKLSVTFFDFLKIPALMFFFKYAVLFLFILSAVYSLAMLVTGLIRRLMKKKRISPPFHYLFCGATVTAVFSYAAFVLGLLTYQGKTLLNVFLVIYGLMFVLQMAFLIGSVLKQKYARIALWRGKCIRVCDILAAVFCLCMTITFQIFPLL